VRASFHKVYVIDFMFFDQHFTLVIGLYVESFLTIHSFTFLHGFNNSSVSSAVPYSCLLLNMCNAHAEIWLLVLMNRV